MSCRAVLDLRATVAKRWDVLGFGAVAVDDLFYVDHHPQPDTKTRATAERRAAGGLTATALVAAARLGARAAYAGVLGDDALSRFSVEELEREGVDCGPCLRRPDARPIHAVVVVDRASGRRTIVFSDLGVVDRTPEEITSDMIRGARVLLLDHTAIPAGLRAAALARDHGIPVVGDFERVTDPLALELMGQVDHLILGVELAGMLAGSSAPEAIVRVLASPERACFAVTAGERGCWYAERDGPIHHVPALKVAAVDTTGCGDVFHGAYAASLARRDGIDRAIHVATAAAGLKATQPGGRTGIPDRAQVEAALGVRPC